MTQPHLYLSVRRARNLRYLSRAALVRVQSKGKAIYKVYLTELTNSVKNYSKESFPLSYPLPR